MVLVSRAAALKASALLGLPVKTLSEALTNKKILVTSAKEVKFCLVLSLFFLPHSQMFVFFW